MQDVSVSKFLDSASPNEDVIFLVAVNQNADLSAVKVAKDQKSRLAALKNAYALVKEPRLSLFSRYRKDGLRILNDMDGSAMFVVAGRPDGWRKFLREQKSLLDGEDLSLIPNEAIASIA